MWSTLDISIFLIEFADVCMHVYQRQYYNIQCDMIHVVYILLNNKVPRDCLFFSFSFLVFFFLL